MTLHLAAVDGATRPQELTVTRTKDAKVQSELFARQQRWHSITTHVADLLIAAFLICVASLLLHQRREHKTSLLISLALLMMAGTNCWRLWDRLDWTWPDQLLPAAWLTLMLIAIPALPDGRYRPNWSRWFVIAGPVAGLLLWWSSNFVDALVTAALGVALLIAMLLRLLSTPAGEERQQLKWILLGAGAAVLLWIPGGSIKDFLWNDLSMVERLLVDVTTRVGLVMLAVTLLFSQTRFRLNDAEAAYARSIRYVLLPVLVVVVWDIGTRFAGEALRNFTGGANSQVAVVISTVLTAVFFTPAKAWLTDRTNKAFRGPLLRLEALPSQLVRWQEDDRPSDVARRALAEICHGVGATAATLEVDEDGRSRPVASFVRVKGGVAPTSGNLPRESKRLLVVESAGPPEPLLRLVIGERTDRAVYSREERRTIDGIMEPLADTMRAIIRRAERNRSIGQRLSALEAPLAALNENFATRT